MLSGIISALKKSPVQNKPVINMITYYIYIFIALLVNFCHYHPLSSRRKQKEPQLQQQI